ncbi:MAG: PAS domain-containing protein [Sphaerobacteraceae bacterium]|nr:MAG: PAS domain-containing protein [Sphaerobacteraceae bacterium]
MNDEQARFEHVVVIGASSGGIDAISRLLESIPAEFCAPVIVAQHSDPRRPSQFVSILSRRTCLAVRALEEDMDLETGVVYVVPANRAVEFTESNVKVNPEGNGRPLPSIDRLLSDAAEVFEERLIAVVLTGNGSDGTSGAFQVKSRGGTVIIQDPQTAEYPEMPRSLAPTTVDFVRDLKEIGPLLDALTDPQAVCIPDSTDEGADLFDFLQHLQIQCNVDFNQYKTPTIKRRLRRRLVATRCDDLTQYRKYLAQTPDEYFHLVNSFLIKVTHFFRDSEVYDYLQSVVLPAIIQESRERGHRDQGYQLRIWSAGCSTGEEAYSLAILVAEALGEELYQFNIRIFATDINPESIEFARRGIYPHASVSGMPGELRSKYFSCDDGDFEISKLIRSMVVFGHHDLAQRSPFPNIDLVLSRNVLIYFTPELQRRAMSLFAYSLRENGYLALGKAETTSPLGEHFSTDNQRLKIYRRNLTEVPIPPGLSQTALLSSRSPSRISTWNRPQISGVDAKLQETGSTRGLPDRTENLLYHMPVGIVVIDRNYDIRAINNLARRFLGVHGAAVGDDLLHVIRTITLDALRDAIDEAFRWSEPVTVAGEHRVETIEGEHLYIEITCQRRDLELKGQPSHTVIVVLTDVTEVTVERHKVAEARDQAIEENQQLNNRLGQLLRSNQQLVGANEELTRVNEDLRINNEDLLVSSEEAQSSAEEIETLNEEMQTTNEELETLNEELQATVEELNAANEEMQARATEMQQQRLASDVERAKLEAILVSMDDAVVVMDEDGRTLLVNDAFKQMFGDDLSCITPETETGSPMPDSKSPRAAALRGESFTLPFTVSGPDGSRRWFEANGGPIDNAGSVTVIREITDRSLRRLQEEFMSIASHELRTPLTALQGYLNMLQKHISSDSERSRRFVSVALTMVDRLTRMTSELLDVSRLQSGKFALSLEPIQLDELIRQTVELVQSTTPDREIHVELPDAALQAQVDPMRIQQVFFNLLLNAASYSDAEEKIHIRLMSEGDHAVVQVQDHGMGIPEETRAEIFNRFYQGERGSGGTNRGLGLGLYISREIVIAHQGEISVESTPGEGTTFSVRVPLVA